MNIAIILIFIIILFSFVLGLIYAISGTFLPYHVAFTGKTESNVKAYDSELMILIEAFIRLMGIYVITISIANLFILFFGFYKKEKWAWIYFLISVCIMFSSLLILTFPVLGFSMNYFYFVAFLILGIIALAISYKEFF
ncbi:MAG: hypothetical protein EU529_05155 [Promethearchaeota archaeon]|nr:MAG: hypothetical protein EU529_05155 [Candidatus Lokiarchaeota archaeon]